MVWARTRMPVRLFGCQPKATLAHNLLCTLPSLTAGRCQQALLGLPMVPEAKEVVKSVWKFMFLPCGIFFVFVFPLFSGCCCCCCC